MARAGCGTHGKLRAAIPLAAEPIEHLGLPVRRQGKREGRCAFRYVVERRRYRVPELAKQQLVVSPSPSRRPEVDQPFEEELEGGGRRTVGIPKREIFVHVVHLGLPKPVETSQRDDLPASQAACLLRSGPDCNVCDPSPIAAGTRHSSAAVGHAHRLVQAEDREIAERTERPLHSCRAKPALRPRASRDLARRTISASVVRPAESRDSG